jgi:hypothetical protein
MNGVWCSSVYFSCMVIHNVSRERGRVYEREGERERQRERERDRERDRETETEREEERELTSIRLKV